jgi:hypothetical protein
MSLLHRYPDAAALETRDEGLRREVLEEPPKLERWDLVESRWNLGSVLVVLAGAALAVLGWVAAARTGLNETWYRPVEEVAGLRHTPLLAAVEAGGGVVLVIAGLAGARGLAAFVCIAGAIAAGVAALEPELIAEELALERWWAITLAAAGTGWPCSPWCPGRTSSNASTPARPARPRQRSAGPTPGLISGRSAGRPRLAGHEVHPRVPRSRQVDGTVGPLRVGAERSGSRAHR